MAEAAGNVMDRILVVDDEAQLVEALCEVLSDGGYDVVSAGNGEEALQKLSSFKPSLILSDISMPRINGLGLLERVRNDFPHLVDVPFLFLTAFASKEHEIEARNAGADGYIAKPVDFELLLATLQSRLRQVERMRERKEQ